MISVLSAPDALPAIPVVAALGHEDHQLRQADVFQCGQIRHLTAGQADAAAEDALAGAVGEEIVQQLL